ncbi:PREDICTED: stigma-specific STIG1-like protein 4 [Tarenaya hassleriana]|uniref:stigma-specific STIG1-like protein 4 n=1 Tax=Tarenaya hassleriana TaxID=28532 RepID=UPI00053C27C7|nr:PREDICTED: stigma-specific STIG1-like protein 4 [Tarenaya hassleriana]
MTKLSYALLFLVHSLIVLSDKQDYDYQVHENSNETVHGSSAWLKNQTTNWHRPKPPGCWSRPWICKQGAPPRAVMRCCRNQCVDVSSDVNHCRFCNRNCPFSWLCCDGNCVNVNTDPFNCGRCGNMCPVGAPCEFGMCGYAQPSPPQWPPRHPRHPKFRWPKPPPSSESSGKGSE